MDPSSVLPLENFQGDTDRPPASQCMSNDVDVWVAEAYENYDINEMQGTQAVPLEEIAEDVVFMQPQFPDANFYEELYQPGEFWFATGPPTSLDDETGQTRGGTCVPDYIDPDAEIDPSDADWQNPTTLNDAVCTFPMYKAQARTATASGTTHTATLPDYAAGDGVLLLVATSAVEVLTPPSGWGVVFQRSSTTLTTNLTIAAYWRVMDGTEGATVDVTSAAAATLTFQAFSFTQVDPYTGPDSATDVTTGANDNPPSLTHDWPDQKTMWVMLDFGPDNTHTITNVPVPYRTWGLFGFPTGGANQYVMAGLRQLEAATDDPTAFTGAITSSATATIAIRGYCADDLNSDPAGQSIPVELEPEAEVDCYGWQSQGPTDDPLGVVVDDLLTVTSIPDWLEPDAEPNPEDIGSGGWSFGATDDGIICYYPIVESVATDTSGAAGTGHLITMPSGIVSGDKLVMFLWTDGGANVTALTGWTRIGSSLAAEAKLYVRVADGTEGATQAVTFSASVRQAAITYRISTLYEGDDWYQLAEDLTNGAGSPPITHTYSTGPYLTLASVMQFSSAKTALGGFTNLQSSDTDAGAGTFGAVAQRVSEEQTITPGAWSANNNGDTFYTLVIPGLCIGERYETGSQWTAVTEPQEDVFEESPEWVRTPTFEFDGDTEPAPHYYPDDLEPEAEALQDGWQQSVTVEDFPLDPEIQLTSVPTDLEPEAEVDSEGWHSSPLHDFPDNADINSGSVPDALEPEAEPDTNGWQAAPLHDTPSTADITGTSVPEYLLPDNEEGGFVGFEGFSTGPLHDAPAAPEPAPDTSTSVGTLPGHVARKRWWIERSSKEDTSRRRRYGTTWPDLPEPKSTPPFRPKVITSKTARPRLDQISRDWKLKMRRAREADDLIIATIIAALLTENKDDNDS